MKRAIKIILQVSFISAFAIFMFFFARLRREQIEASLPVAGRIQDFSMAGQGSAGPEQQGREALRSRISPDYNEVFLDALDINLDDDLDLEQLVVAKSATGDPRGLSLIVADILPATGVYARVWKGLTPVVKATTLVIQPRDLLKDGRLEILCFGVDGEDNQSLTIFRQSAKSDGSFNVVFSHAGLDVSLVEPAQAEGEETAEDQAAIDLILPDPKEGSPLDRLRIRYRWNARTEKFVPDRPLPIPGANIERNLMDSIVTNDPRDFESYLEGLWKKSGSGASVGAADPVLVYFSPSDREIILQEGEIQQRWRWGESSHAFAGLRAPINNALLSGMLRLLSVELIGVEKIRIQAVAQQFLRFPVRESWNGQYERAGRDGLESLAGGKASSDPGDIIHGDFKDGQGRIWSFSGGAYSMDGGGEGEKGFYMMQEAGGLAVLDLVQSPLPRSDSIRKTFIVSKAGEDAESLVLSPAVRKIDAPELLYKPDIVLRRVLGEDQGSR
ncbi:MAG: pallilysin-related adhesin [Spirochaetota bacterium]